MKKTLSIFVVAAAVLLLATACKKESYDTFATISGTVVEMGNGEPVGNALLTLMPGNINTYTGSDGTFQFNDVEAKQYTLTAQKTGYKANRKTIDAEAGQTLTVSLTMEKQATM